MKLNKTFALILFSALFVFAACKKEEVTTSDNETTTENVVAEPVGGGDTDGGGDGDGDGDTGADATVIVYSAEWCSACTYLKEQLDGEGVEYTVKDVDEPENSSECYDEIIAAGYEIEGGSYSIPVAKVGDNPALYGEDCTLENILDQL